MLNITVSLLHVEFHGPDCLVRVPAAQRLQNCGMFSNGRLAPRRAGQSLGGGDKKDVYKRQREDLSLMPKGDKLARLLRL